MKDKKEIIILIIIALVLAATAITLNIMDSEVPTTRTSTQDQPGDGTIGIDIKQPQVENKLTEQTPPQ